MSGEPACERGAVHSRWLNACRIQNAKGVYAGAWGLVSNGVEARGEMMCVACADFQTRQ
ncbi:hypothetical protein NOV72_00971 [Caballeronia novacaledonica]|uniref:Uncharacterized protein n=1 Tax=Caballeronia novacaledonica TaxID=1544861 RepID=A0A2U3I0T0_9BURK|nr:hypothetical protein NOV72_00971 [Caballeronia novacaledonica]